MAIRGGHRIFFRGGAKNQHAKRVQILREAQFFFWVFAPPKLISPPPQQAIFGGGKMSLGGGQKLKNTPIFLKYLVTNCEKCIMSAVIGNYSRDQKEYKENLSI